VAFLFGFFYFHNGTDWGKGKHAESLIWVWAGCPGERWPFSLLKRGSLLVAQGRLWPWLRELGPTISVGKE
jgi:hypothetical protein